MIGSHNSLTFKASNNWLFNQFEWLWKCQHKSLQEQYENGVRFFDIRVYQKDPGHWGFAHGMVNLYGGFDTVRTILLYMNSIFPEAYFRVVLEKGNKKTIQKFKEEVAQAIEDFSGKTRLYQAIIKSGWEIVYCSEKEFIIKDYCYTPILTGESFWYNLKHLKLSSIKKYAKKHNPTVSQEIINDPVEVHFMDFV